MVYKATQDVVRRGMPLLGGVATRSVDKARVFQVFLAPGGEGWGGLGAGFDLEGTTGSGVKERILIFRDRASGAEHPLLYPSCLPLELEPLVREEYKRLAVDRPLTLMSEELFAHFYRASYCDHCRWRGSEHGQIHRECRF